MIRILQRNYISLITGFPMIAKHYKKHSTLNVSTENYTAKKTSNTIR